MKERPILFSGPMVKAILDGRKTQTRRIVKPGVLDDGWPDVPPLAIAYAAGRCPYGAPGDRLWVRETHALVDAPSRWPSQPHSYDMFASQEGREFRAIHYAASFSEQGPRWRPSIHMPRWASRLDLEVTDMRVERLQDISGEDARAEGIDDPRCPCEPCARSSNMCPADAGAHVESFAVLWDKINAERAAWASNPWVWVVSFKRTTSPEAGGVGEGAET